MSLDKASTRDFNYTFKKIQIWWKSQQNGKIKLEDSVSSWNKIIIEL